MSTLHEAHRRPRGRAALPLRAAVTLALALAASPAGPAAAATAPAARAAGTPASDRAWPAGTEIVPFELRDGQILARATLRSPSGGEATGLLVFDTGAPGLVVTRTVWAALRLDTLHAGGNILLLRRPLDELEMGSLRAPRLAVDGAIADGLLDPGVIGLFGPSVLGDRAIVVDYDQRSLAIVNRSLTLVRPDTTSLPRGADVAAFGRARRSRARFGAILGPDAVAVPFRMFRGGRMLVMARLEDPATAWRSAPLALLLDTGASSCVLFEDAVAERAPRLPSWIRQRDVTVRTVLGEGRADMALLPRLRLTEALGGVAEDDVGVGRTARQTLPDLQGELPDPVHGLLGYSFLRRFRPVVDYADEVLWLLPRGAAHAADRASAAAAGARAEVGLVVAPVAGTLVVVAVAPRSAAAASGIAEGEAIVSIDGVRAAGIGADEAARLLAGTPGSPVVVITRRGGMERVHRLTRGARR
jgi:hypothetical protein